jgi:tRNA(fMet)-specific endonuclease VapC
LITPQPVDKNRILVDTDVLSFLLKDDTRASFFKPYLIHKSLAVSFVTVAELYYWAYVRAWGHSRIIELETRIKNYLVLPYDYSLCQRWAKTRAECEAKGFPIHDDNDCWIASTALAYDCALATNNGRHFKYIDGLTLISPGLI